MVFGSISMELAGHSLVANSRFSPNGIIQGVQYRHQREDSKLEPDIHSQLKCDVIRVFAIHLSLTPVSFPAYKT